MIIDEWQVVSAFIRHGIMVRTFGARSSPWFPGEAKAVGWQLANAG